MAGLTTWIGTSLSTPSGSGLLLPAETKKEPKGVRHAISISGSSSSKSSCSPRTVFIPGPLDELNSSVHGRSARLAGGIGTATSPMACRRGRGQWRVPVSVRENSLATEQSGGMTGMAKEGTKKNKKETKQGKENKNEVEEEDKIIHVNTRQELAEVLRGAGSKLAVVEYTAKEEGKKRIVGEEEEQQVKIYPSIVQLSKSMTDVIFIIVELDKSEESKEMHKEEKIDKLPHFAFYKNMEVVHREEGLDAEQLVGDVLYYGDSDAPIFHIKSREDAESFLAEHANDHKLVVVDVSLKECNPCVRVYPTVVNLSRRMSDFAVFARMFGDENAACSQMLKEMGVCQVPTFLFIRDGRLCGRYVGSGKGELIGEILRYQGVKVT